MPPMKATRRSQFDRPAAGRAVGSGHNAEEGTRNRDSVELGWGGVKKTLREAP